ncbi:hypothetical protein Pla175_37130 [Pirellulimonas nuda]|uniref:Carboxypeptidase regulatory-like domain-containing protein n=1 Tax=Pirellulimonas nuda TaxID=2528009 RepID=A0A518DFQ2_9BACT|nr:carboxypeptidase-like regulatory domain-containing protein [Pirellulimonas nuda]QDU90310.1 hypothetical protein Pla175_37130 [Pirellulimonas nuda]
MNASRLLAAALLASACSQGCSKPTPDGRLPVFPTSGKVTRAGAPVAGARVTLYGATETLQGPSAPIPTATTDADGAFELRSYDPNDGAPAGDFLVAITLPEQPPEGDLPEEYVAKDLLRGKYDNPDRSGLKAAVPEGGGELPTFDLK